MRIVTFNAWVGQDPRDLAQHLEELAHDTDRPEVIAVQEAKRYGGSIPGYERVAASMKHLEDRSCLLLVRRRGVKIHRERELRIVGPWWTGPHGDRHPPRVYPGVGIETPEGRAVVLNVHRTPIRNSGKPGVAGSWAAEHVQLRAWLNDRTTHPAAAVGDWNGRESDTEPMSVSDLAQQTRTDLRLRGIDGALTKGFEGRTRKLDQKYGSDGHHPVVVDLRWKDEK